MAARIFRPAKTAMQSGKSKSRNWVLEYIADTPRSRDPLMGWTSSADTRQQLRLVFATKDEAVAYAKKNGLAYRVEEPHSSERKRKSYAENFKWGRVETWTH
ncbi:MAG: ETC complex I subunit [Hyphomicrobiales bacterium]